MSVFSHAVVRFLPRAHKPAQPLTLASRLDRPGRTGDGERRLLQPVCHSAA